MKCHSSYILQAIHLLAVMYLLGLTLMPVEVRWAESYMLLLWSLPVLCAAGLYGIIFVNKTNPLKITMVDSAIVVWSLYYLLRVYIGGEYPCATDFLKTCTIVLLYASLRILFNSTKLSAWWIIAILIFCGVYEAISGISQMINGTSRHHLFMLTGNFQNPGPYSAYLMMGSVIGLCAMQEKIYGHCPYRIETRLEYFFAKFYMLLGYERNIKSNKVFDRINFHIDEMPNIKHIIAIPTILILIVLPSTWSRAAFVGLVFCVLWIYREKYKKYKYVVWITICVVAIYLYIIKQGSADGRIITWMSSLTSWIHKPWLGVGVGGFRNACAEGIAELWHSNPNSTLFNSAGVTDYAYNVLLKILVEQGLIGVTLCLLLATFSMTKLYTQSKPLFMGMLSLLIFSMFSYPFELLPYRTIAVVIIAWNESCTVKSICSMGHIKTLLLAEFLAFASWQTYKEILVSYEVDKEFDTIRGIHEEAFVLDYYGLLPLEGDNADFLFDFGKTLRKQKRYNDSNAMLRQGTLCSADPMFYVLMGNNYRDMQHYDLAEQSYKEAFAVMPNRLYPLYQLMLMYNDCGDKSKAKSMARQIIVMKPKIESPAIRDMKQKAKDIMHDTRESRKSLTE